MTLNKVMKQQVIKYYSLFLLVVFLFPMAEKELHSLEHRNDTHCSSTQKHFHQNEHHCFICDYITPHNNGASVTIKECTIDTSVFEYTLKTDSFFSRQQKAHLPSRAPPIC